MALTKYKLGVLIEQCDNRNKEGFYTVEDVRGISTGKEFIETKANMDGVSLSSYKIVEKNEFAYVADTSRRGDKIAIAFNTDNVVIISSIYTVFRISRTDLLLSDYLFIYFNRPEFDRYSRFNSWGSARETFDWSDMCDIEIELPSIEIQQKYVAIYKAMVKNQQSYERGLEDLKLTIDATIEKFKQDTKRIPLDNIIIETSNLNTNGLIQSVNGVNKDKRFMPSVSNGADLTKYKIVQKNQFACNLMHVGRDVTVPVALNSSDEMIIVSPAYMVYKIKDNSILPEFLLIWLSRTETDRRAWFMCDTSVRSGMEKKRFLEIEIPIPTLVEQKSIIEIYNSLSIRKDVNEQLKTQIKNICPILIKGSIEEARK